MRCEQALERMLVAEPAALTGETDADPELAAHLKGCGRCRAVASALAGELALLEAGLQELAGEMAAPIGAPPGAPAGASATRRTSGRLSRRVWVPLLLAASVATVVVLGREPWRSEPVPAVSAPGRMERPLAPRVGVTVGTDRTTAVLATANPNITVVWLYERSDR